ncbi:CGNR zinc finger domain-containing protein [Kibdelosporangium philippinense]|uniref:CGNR zinc finger domain-containing protein n=1 Tax=Kibdelosporangium philippinense TaxID=211113 RepID=A0ABS8Z8P9_9PSEU|nr:CGNR zinc finger domain-containing protein [Kibdelosporangium philippinense]MCE7003041.1 CGNR zinc finger domain-containing protein [Kibdelosporangium philippinense]
MVTLAAVQARLPWQEAHFVGGHPVLDLTNTVFNRKHPAEDGELLKTPADVLTWCASVGLFEDIPSRADADLPAQVQVVREEVWAVFDALGRGEALPHKAFGALLERAGVGVRTERVQQTGAALDRVNWAAPGAIPAALSLLAVQALFTLPAERVRACGRCGWMFLDSSRGGRRRWCSMSTCGNREKASRHRHSASVV